MSETEITLARAYLQAAGQDPVAALIRSVRDIARLRRSLVTGPAQIDHDGRAQIRLDPQLGAASAAG